MNITGQIGSIVYATTPGFDALMDDDLELAEEFMSNASKLIKGITDMAVGDKNADKIQYEDDNRTVRIPTPNIQDKVYAIVNETGGITYMLAEEY